MRDKKRKKRPKMTTSCLICFNSIEYVCFFAVGHSFLVASLCTFKRFWSFARIRWLMQSAASAMHIWRHQLRGRLIFVQRMPLGFRSEHGNIETHTQCKERTSHKLWATQQRVELRLVKCTFWIKCSKPFDGTYYKVLYLYIKTKTVFLLNM